MRQRVKAHPNLPVLFGVSRDASGSVWLIQVAPGYPCRTLPCLPSLPIPHFCHPPPPSHLLCGWGSRCRRFGSWSSPDCETACLFQIAKFLSDQEYFPLGGLDVQLEVWDDLLSLQCRLCILQQVCEAMLFLRLQGGTVLLAVRALRC